MANAFERTVGFLTDHESDVALDLVRNLFPLPLKSNLVSILHAALNVNPKSFFLLNQLVTPADGAHMGKHLSFAPALATRLLHLHLHHSHVDVLSYMPLSMAHRARLEVTAFSARPLASLAINVARNCVLCCRTSIQFF